MEPLRIDNLFARRSIRKYTSEPVTDEQVQTLLEAAMAAPSAANSRPWHFVVVRDQQMLEALAAPHPYASMLPSASVCIVPCGVPATDPPRLGGYWVQDLSAATENILLAATGLGLGAVWCGLHPIPERVQQTREILGMPEEAIPLGLVAVGHPAQSPTPRTQYDEERVHREKW